MGPELVAKFDGITGAVPDLSAIWFINTTKMAYNNTQNTTQERIENMA